MPTTRAQVVAWMVAASLCAPVAAQPVIRIGAEARIELSTRREGEVVRVSAKLLDDQDRPLSGLTLGLYVATVEGARVVARSDLRTTREGEVEIALPDRHERIVVTGRFEGDAFHPNVEAVETFDLGLAPVALSVVEPASSVLDLGMSTHAVVVRARSIAGSAGLLLTFLDEDDRVLASATTDREGVARAELVSSQLGAPGLGKLRVRAPQDVARAAAETEIAIVRWNATALSLELDPQIDGSAIAQGALRAGATPVPYATISVFDAREAHVASFVTDELGRFAGVLEAPRLEQAAQGAQRVSLRARYVSDVPWLGSSESKAREVAVELSHALRNAWLLATPVVIGLLLFALRRMRVRAQSPAPQDAQPGAGVSLGRASRVRASSMLLGIDVVDARTRKPVAGAHATLTDRAGTPTRAHATADGAIALTAASAGEHALRIEADGYRALDARLHAPHRGEWTHAVIRLESLRDAALAAWTPVAQRLAAGMESANASTVRETLERAAHQAHVAHVDALELIASTEQAAYARTQPQTSDVVELEQQAANMARAIEDKQRA